MMKSLPRKEPVSPQALLPYTKSSEISRMSEGARGGKMQLPLQGN